MLFFTKICIAVHLIEHDRSIARCTPPPIDMWAPRRIFDSRFSNFDLEDLMNEPQMKNRTKQFALRVLKMADALPTNRSGNVIANQIVRCSTSVAANYRALCRAKSRADFVNKTSIVEEEADESGFWLELIVDAGLMTAARVKPLLDEASEITAMLVASRKTAVARSR
jgi:four helix bundle protein